MVERKILSHRRVDVRSETMFQELMAARRHHADDARNFGAGAAGAPGLPLHDLTERIAPAEQLFGQRLVDDGHTARAGARILPRP